MSTLLSGIMILTPVALLHGQYQPPPPEDYDHTGWTAVSGTGVVVDGSEATFQLRHQMPARAFGGLDSFYWETFPTGNLILQIEARSLFDEHTHHITFGLENPEGGFLRAGFRQFRTWYDGSGGYFPPADTWFTLHDPKMHIDRGDLWVEAGMTNAGGLAWSLRYTHQYRRGLKDSAIWGRSELTADLGRRAFAPSFREIDESRHIFEGQAEYTISRTELGLGLRYELSEQDGTLVLNMQPEEASERSMRYHEGTDSNIFTTHAWTRTELTDTAQVATAYMYTRMNTDVIGSRIFDPEPGFREYEVHDLTARLQVRQHVANVNMVLNPWEHVYIIPSLRAELQDTTPHSRFEQGGDQNVMSEKDLLVFSERLEMRYNGLKRWHLYARGDWMQGQGDLEETSSVADDREIDFDRRSQRYTAGANWSPIRGYSLAFQYFHEIRRNDSNHIVSGRTGQDLEKQDFTTDSFNVRLTSRPLNNVTLVSRYDLRLSRIDTVASKPGSGNDPREVLPEIRSGDMTRHIISQSATWAPLPRLYVQASANYARDRTETPAQDAGGAAAGRVLESENDYLFASLSTGFAYSPKTDLELTYTYYRSDNYVDNSESSVAYGVGEYEHGVKAGIVHRIHENFVWYGGYGFFLFREDTTGGNRDYDAHTIYSGLALNF